MLIESRFPRKAKNFHYSPQGVLYYNGGMNFSSIVNEIQIDGAERIKAKALRKDIAVKINQTAKEDDLEKGRQKIIERYQAHGFTDVDVKFRIEPIDPSAAEHGIGDAEKIGLWVGHGVK